MAAARASKLSNGAFIAALAVTLFFFYEVVAPFVLPVLVAAFLVVLVEPLHEKLVRRLGGRRRAASFLSSFGVLLLCLLPSAAVVYLLVDQGVVLLANAREALGPDGLEELMGGRIPAALAPVVERIEGLGVKAQLQEMLNSAATWLTGAVAGLFGATTRLSIDLFLTVISMYYFFLDGPRLLGEAMRLSPLESRYELEFLREFRDVAHTMIYVNLVTALIQGLVGGIGFWLVGLPQPLVWATLMAFFSLVPILGTGLIWAPAVMLLLLTGHPWAGLFLLCWGVVVIAGSDNFLRPLLAKGRIRLHPLLIFVTIFGGLAAFGPVGAIVGPLIGSILTAMLRIWKRDFVPRLAGDILPGPSRELDGTTRARS